MLDAGAAERTLTGGDVVALIAGSGAASAQEPADAIHDAAVGGTGPPRDDIAILAVRVRAAPPVAGGVSTGPLAAAESASRT